MVMPCEEPLESGCFMSVQMDRMLHLLLPQWERAAGLVMEFSAKSMLLKGQQDVLTPYECE